LINRLPAKNVIYQILIFTNNFILIKIIPFFASLADFPSLTTELSSSRIVGDVNVTFTVHLGSVIDVMTREHSDTLIAMLYLTSGAASYARHNIYRLKAN